GGAPGSVPGVDRDAPRGAQQQRDRLRGRQRGSRTAAQTRRGGAGGSPPPSRGGRGQTAEGAQKPSPGRWHGRDLVCQRGGLAGTAVQRGTGRGGQRGEGGNNRSTRVQFAGDTGGLGAWRRSHGPRSAQEAAAQPGPLWL